MNCKGNSLQVGQGPSMRRPVDVKSLLSFLLFFSFLEFPVEKFHTRIA
jgi:hypothetical protein